MAGMMAIAALGACGGGDKATAPDNSPATVTPNGTIQTSAVIAAPINPAPSVVVKNSRGTPLPNVRVTFLVASGGGAVTGESQLTDASGVATVGGWTLGTTTGPQTLTASAGGKSTTFTVNATNTCNLSGAITVGATVTGDLSTSPCGLGDGTAVQSWSFEQAASQAPVSFSMQSTGASKFDTFLLLYRNAYTAFDRVIAGNDNASTASTDSRLDVILGTGNYVVSANNLNPGETGPFTLNASAWTGDLDGCNEAFMTTGVTTDQNMTSACQYNSGRNIDVVGLFLAKGQQVQVDMSSTAFDPSLDFYLFDGTPVLQDDNGGGGTSARITYTAPASGIYVVVPTSPTAAQTGAYRLAVTSLSGAPVGPSLIGGANPIAVPGLGGMPQVKGAFARNIGMRRRG
jgi:hypothetical protein